MTDKKRISQNTKGLKKEKIQSIENEAANSEISAKEIVSWGNILKAFLNYNSDDPFMFDSDDEKDVAHIKDEYESTIIVIKELSYEVVNITTACKDQKILLHITDEK